MKQNNKLRGLVTLALALSVGTSVVLASNSVKASAAAAGYSENLVTNSTFDAYSDSLTSTYQAGDKIALPYGQYEVKQHDVYCRPAVDGGSGYWVKTEDSAYINLAYDGEATGDSIEFWLQPGKLSAGTYTIEIDFELVGFSTGDCLLFNFNGAQTYAIFNANDYAAVADSDVAGLKKLSYQVTIAEDTEFPATHLWFYHKFMRSIEVHLHNIKYKAADGTVAYENDFMGPFNESLAGSLGDGSKGYNDGVNASIVKEGENIALKMGADSAFNTPIKIDGVGIYRIQMDLKPSEDYEGKLNILLAAVDATYNSSTKVIAQSKSDFDFLDDADDGWVHYSGTILLNNFMAAHTLSLYTKHSGAGSVLIDNVSVEKKLDSIIQHETPSTEGLEFTDIVLGGDFEYLDEGYTFVAEPQQDSNFWGSTALDSPGKIVTLDGNKVLKIAYDSADTDKATCRWASAFVFLDASKFSTEDVFTLSYKYKYEGKEGFNPGIGFQATFIGATGVEHYVQYLNWVDTLQETSGVNTNEWPFTVTELENGWKQVTLTFKMDTAFVSQVDSIRFLNYNNCQEDVVLYVDDVVYGVWKEAKTDTPNDSTSSDSTNDNNSSTTPVDSGDNNTSSGGCSGSVSMSMAIVTLAVTGFVLAKKGRKDE